MLMLTQNETKENDDEVDEFTRLADCFKHISGTLYKTTMDRAQLLKQLHFLTGIFLAGVPSSPT